MITTDRLLRQYEVENDEMKSIFNAIVDSLDSDWWAEGVQDGDKWEIEISGALLKKILELSGRIR